MSDYCLHGMRLIQPLRMPLPQLPAIFPLRYIAPSLTRTTTTPSLTTWNPSRPSFWPTHFMPFLLKHESTCLPYPSRFAGERGAQARRSYVSTVLGLDTSHIWLWKRSPGPKIRDRFLLLYDGRMRVHSWKDLKIATARHCMQPPQQFPVPHSPYFWAPLWPTTSSQSPHQGGRSFPKLCYLLCKLPPTSVPKCSTQSWEPLASLPCPPLFSPPLLFLSSLKKKNCQKDSKDRVRKIQWSPVYYNRFKKSFLQVWRDGSMVENHYFFRPEFSS